jgi:hypothetical protein
VGGAFQDVEQFRAALGATRDSLTSVNQSRRAAQLALLAACLCVPALLSVGVFLVALALSPPFVSLVDTSNALGQAERARQDLDAGAARELAVAAISPDPRVRLAGVCQWEADGHLASQLHEQRTVARREQQARLRCLSPFSREVTALFTTEVEKVGRGFVLWQDFRKEARWNLTRLSERSVVGSVPLPVVYLVAACLFAAVLTGLLARGGVTFLMAGIRVVRRDGRPASRLQCAGRALLAWTPLAAMLLLAVGLDAWQLATWQRLGGRAWLTALAGAAWWAAVGVLPLQAALALWSPDRSWHDRLAGTFLVPR